MRIKLSENFRAVFYAPFYATHALGFYAGEGVEVDLLSSPAPAAAAAGLLDGSIDIAWGGPMRVMKARDDDPAFAAFCFCEVAGRDPFFLVGKCDPVIIPARRSAPAEGRHRVRGRRPGSFCSTTCALRARSGTDRSRDRADDGGQSRGAAPGRARCRAYVRALRVDGVAGRGRRDSLRCERARADLLYDVPRQPRQRSPQPRGIRRHGAGHPPDADLRRGARRGGIGRRGCAVLPARSRRDFSPARSGAIAMRAYGRAHRRCRGRDLRGSPTA